MTDPTAEWVQARRAIETKRIKEIVAEFKCTQRTAYRVYSLEETCQEQAERLVAVNIELFELKHGPISQYSHWDLGMVVSEDQE